MTYGVNMYIVTFWHHWHSSFQLMSQQLAIFKPLSNHLLILSFSTCLLSCRSSQHWEKKYSCGRNGIRSFMIHTSLQCSQLSLSSEKYCDKNCLLENLHSGAFQFLMCTNQLINKLVCLHIFLVVRTKTFLVWKKLTLILLMRIDHYSSSIQLAFLSSSRLQASYPTWL